jgi:hypothetical protein
MSEAIPSMGPHLKLLPKVRDAEKADDTSYTDIVEQIEALVYKLLKKGQQEGVPAGQTISALEGTIQEAFSATVAQLEVSEDGTDGIYT